MAGLLIKDLKNISNQFVYYLAAFLGLIIFSVLTENVYILGGIVFLSVSLPLSALTADEKVNFDAFALAAGISRKKLVLYRYMVAYCVGTPLLGCGYAVAALAGYLDFRAIAALAAYGGMSFFVINAMFPIVLKKGPEHAQMAYLIMFAGVVLMSVFFAVAIELLGEIAVWVIAFLPFFLGCFSFIPSVICALNVYKNKDF